MRIRSFLSAGKDISRLFNEGLSSVQEQLIKLSKN